MRQGRVSKPFFVLCVDHAALFNSSHFLQEQLNSWFLAPYMKPQTRDNLIYLAVGLSVAALVTVDFSYTDSRGREMWMPSRFTFRAVYSTGLLGYFVARETRKVKAAVFQVLMCVLFGGILHLAIAFGFRHAIDELPGLTFAALAAPETFLIVQLMVKAAQYLMPRGRSA